jgi:Lon protease-like protein
MRLPLHIFEPRYRRMIQDARRDELPIVIGHVLSRSQPPDEAERVHAVAGVGFIEGFQELPDGRFVIELVGEERVRIVEEQVTEFPYRVVRAERMVDDVVSEEASKPAIDALRRVILAIHRNDKRAAAALSSAIAGGETAAEISDAVAAALQMNPLVLQSLLDETNPLTRLEKVTLSLEGYLMETATSPRTLN